MPIRNIIQIDEALCNGCGQCVVDCAEGALEIVDGKARLIKESYCDGLGACIGNCPTGALTIEQRDAPEFALPEHLAATAAHAPATAPPPPPSPAPIAGGGGCPGARSFQFQRAAAPAALIADLPDQNTSALTHWPVQLHLVNFSAPHFRNKEIVLAADCSAFACASFHPRLLQGRVLAIACPKLDDPTGYHEKLIAMYNEAAPPKVLVVRMEVPCCRGITQWAVAARRDAGSAVPIEEVVIGVEGAVIARNIL